MTDVVRLGAVCVAGLLLAACGDEVDRADSAPAAEGEAAVWVLGADARPGPSSTTFTALVTRLGCNNGVTGRVLDPVVETDERQVVVRFAVAPAEPGGANCQGNDQVPVRVELPEPLGDRRLVDGECLPGGEAATTSFCDPDGVRSGGRG